MQSHKLASIEQETAGHAEIILHTARTLVEPLATLIPGECEVVLHDLRLLPNSIVAVAGNLTGRAVGGSATDLLLRASATGNYSTTLGYIGKHSDGRELRSSTIIFRDIAGNAIAALCINSDTHDWRILAELARSMMPAERTGSPEAVGAGEPEEFLGDVEEVAQHVLKNAINSVGVPINLFQKSHKLAVIQALKERGFFTLKESVEKAAQELGVTRFTIYNYLNELEQKQA
ncbi:transcriptional regulator [Paenarthrobacter sp. NPDC056912]|uniref:helix-turn-helix transcriptional regulator n=1 Tax=Paenarthrobacter sp. NPDC056912 TaxID=3345965 RepID=UPI00366E53BB